MNLEQRRVLTEALRDLTTESLLSADNRELLDEGLLADLADRGKLALALAAVHHLDRIATALERIQAGGIPMP